MTDSPVPAINPYFMIRDGLCTGVWSPKIVKELNTVRPDIQFVELSDSFGEVGFNKEGRIYINPEYPRTKVQSLKLSNYAYLSGAITLS